MSIAPSVTAVTGTVQFRRVEPSDGAAVRTLHERALATTGTDPADVPGTDDLADVVESYLDTGGEFLVGVDPDPGVDADPALAVAGGHLVVMGGYLPCEHGHDDERTVPDGAELHRMRVAPSRQREGHGRAILHRLERRAREAGFDVLLATTATTQAAAVAFYAAEGYDEVDRSTAGRYELVHFEKPL